MSSKLLDIISSTAVVNFIVCIYVCTYVCILSFRLLASRLHSFSSCVIAEHVIPLLVTPLVIAEPQASEHLWQHVLCPSSSSHPKSNEFDPHAINPFVTEEQFRFD